MRDFKIITNRIQRDYNVWENIHRNQTKSYDKLCKNWKFGIDISGCKTSCFINKFITKCVMNTDSLQTSI